MGKFAPIFDFTEYSKRFLKIVTKDTRLIPFQLNHYQLELIKLINKQREAKKPVRIIILKARQVGLSTLSCAYVYHQAATKFYQNSVLVAHDSDSTANLFNIIKRFYDLSPKIIQPLKRYSNRKELVFENPDDAKRTEEPGLLSSIDVYTAGSATAGRSSTINHLHISELAFWPNAAETLSGLLQALSTDPNSTCIIESTANGFDNIGKEFYERIQKARMGISDFEFFFIPWFAVPDYVYPNQSATYSRADVELQKRFNLTNEQLSWRRWKINNDFNGDELLFRQEYPATPEEAFISTGNPVFNVEQLFDLISKAEKNTFETDGFAKIYEKPKPNEVYVIGADIAEGLQDGDFSTAFVMDRNFNQVASIHAHLAPDLFAIELARLGKMYNNALLAPESNNHGIGVIIKLKDISYLNIYRREFFEKQEIDIQLKLGWNTNIKTKQLMLDDLKAAIRDNVLNIKDVDLLRELTTLFYEPDGNVTLGGKDRTVASAIALQAIKQAPVQIKYKAQYMGDDEKQEKFETFQQRMARLNKSGENKYFH